MIRRLVTVLLLSTLAACSSSALASPRPPRPAAPATTATRRLDPAAATAIVEFWLEVQVADYLRARELGDLVAYLGARADADRASDIRPKTFAPNVTPSSTGGHSDAWWAGVSSCEQGGLDNPTYGYFSIMDGSAAGRSYAEQLAEARAIDASAGDGAWAQSCQDAGWAASPSG